ncbi:MAG: hypothetical protein WAS21_23130 [Geminicoccaceae bacterium]
MDIIRWMTLDIRRLVVQAGAAAGCAKHPGILVMGTDEVAERRAYNMAARQWVAGSYGPLVTRKEVMDAVEHIIANIPSRCPQCVEVAQP